MICHKFLPFLLLLGTLTAGSLRIMNDSPYTLYAEILAADGSPKGKLTLAPQQQGNWQDNFSGNSVWSQTPYTVVLTCKNGKQFGVISGVQQGATVTALSATGDLFCEKDKKHDKKAAPPPSEEKQFQEQFNSSPNQSQSPGSADPSGSFSDPNWGPP